MEQRSPHPRAALALLLATVFLDLVGFGIVIPLLPLYAERFGAGPVAVTALLASYSLMQLCFAPWWGRLSDRVGRRPVLLVGLFGSALSYLLFGLAGSLATLFAARALAGAMGANIGVAQAYIADVTPPEHRSARLGLIGAAFGLGFILGPAIGGLLASGGASRPFFFAGGLALVNGLLALVLLPESRPHRARQAVPQRHSRWQSALRFRRVPGMSVLLGTLFLLTFAFAALEATLSLWADRRLRLTPAEVAFGFAYLGVVSTLVQGGLVGPLARRLGDRALAALGLAVLAAGLAALAPADTLPAAAAALALVAFGQGCALPAISALVTRAAPEEERGQLLGVSQSLSALARVVGPLWGGLALARLGLAAPFLSGAVAAGLGLIWLVRARDTA